MQLILSTLVQLPEQLTSILDIIRVASLYMFALFLTGICLSFVSIFLMPLSIYSRWVAVAMTIVSLLNAICVVAASVIGTVMFIIMRNVFRENTTVNIQAEIGVTMYALMWVASAFAVFAFIIQICLMCCCTSRRDVKQHKGKYKNKA
jgi:glucan phosphoethanolaminetransferase (alkaline phosphatase superfamily)